MAHIIRDPGPWLNPFFESARFDAQTGAAGNYIEAALGDQVDCLVLPGLPSLAMGKYAAIAAGVNKRMFTTLKSSSDRKAEFYSMLDCVVRVGKALPTVTQLLDETIKASLKLKAPSLG